MSRLVLILAAGWLSAGPAFADPPSVNRTIGKEPAYQTKAPRYGLLVFGPEGKDRVWLVHDGDCLYVDRNGNGDLTEPDEKVAAQKRAGSDPEKDGYSFEVGQVTVGGRTHKGLQVAFVPLQRYVGDALGSQPEVKAALAKDPKAMAVGISVDAEVAGMKGGGVGGLVNLSAGWRDLNGVFQFADTPAKAPVVHLGGPLQVTFYGERPALRIGRENELVLVVGTPGVGPGTFAMVRYQDTIPESATPVAEITYPPTKPGVPPLRKRLEIKNRC
jgi:hypothetical protein